MLEAVWEKRIWGVLVDGVVLEKGYRYDVSKSSCLVVCGITPYSLTLNSLMGDQTRCDGCLLLLEGCAKAVRLRKVFSDRGLARRCCLARCLALALARRWKHVVWSPTRSLPPTSAIARCPRVMV